MKHSRVLLISGLVCLLPVLAADEKKEEGKEKAAAPAVQVILKRISHPSGETLDEASTISADTGDSLNGKLAINVGSPDQPKYWTVEFGEGKENGKNVIYLNVNDTSLLTQGVREGTSWTAPVELFRVTAPFARSETLTVYRTKKESLTLEITPVTDSAKEKPKAE
ncbi:MAG TPA: hypothetical protein VGE67_07305 [Haloferula sp.]